MASSRWKRFAFFEKNTLNLNSEVLDDLIPDARNRGRDAPLSLVTTSAGLPVASKPPAVTADAASSAFPNEDQDTAMSAMWSSLTACTSQTLPVEDSSLQLPSQVPVVAATQDPLTTPTRLDGLVLAFCSAPVSDLVHCIDVTVRCNPPVTSDKKLEDLDGWRGYFAPFRKASLETANAETQSAASSSSLPASDNDHKVLAIAACRDIKQSHKPVLVASITSSTSTSRVVVWEDPHLHLSCRKPLTSPLTPSEAKVYHLRSSWNAESDGECLSVAIVPGLVAVGTTKGHVLVYSLSNNKGSTASRRGASNLFLSTYIRIPPPPQADSQAVSVQLSLDEGNKASVFVAYRRGEATTASGSGTSAAGICCYEFPCPSSSSTSTIAAPSARHDLDGRSVASSDLVDAFPTTSGLHFTVARSDGLYSYSKTERTAVAPIDGSKITMSLIPPPSPAKPVRQVAPDQAGSGYALVASTDSKSGRDAVDIYDADNKLVAFHLLLSPGHNAIQSAGITTRPTLSSDGSLRSGRSSALVLTSGGQLVTLTEKLTPEKIALLVQKNLYSAAIVVAYADPSLEADSITNLYRQYAEHLYRKGDYGGAMDQYIHTIGSLESSHVLYRYLDSPKIPHLTVYLEQLRARSLATAVHNELLRTCYLKLNDTEAAEALATSGSRDIDKGSLASVFGNISTRPKEALATICSLDAHQAAEALVVHGASLARGLPRETAGVVLSLCVGTYSPRSLADAALVDRNDLKDMLEQRADESKQICKPYPVHLFASSFIEHPRMLRLLLAHCNRNKSPVAPALRRTLLELTLLEWNQAKRSGDTEAEKLRHKEAIAALTDSHCRDIGDYDALVIVQQAGFEEGELLLYERLQMTPMLLERYAKDGSEKSRRQMLAMCKTDPEVLADVLGHLVSIASEKTKDSTGTGETDDDSEDDELNEIMDDVQEALALARRQGVLPPVRIARILAGESSGQFSSGENAADPGKGSIPLSVALDYVGTLLEESRKQISRLETEVEEYNSTCNQMEQDIQSLLKASNTLGSSADEDSASVEISVDELYTRIRADENGSSKRPVEQPDTEGFWREMEQSEDSFDVIARYFAKGMIT